MRHLTANPIVLAALAIAISSTAAGCGSSSEETTGAGVTTAAPPASTSTTPGQEAPVGVRAKSCNGTGSGGEVRVTGVSCELGRSLVAGWYKDGSCSGPKGASRTSCALGRFTCLGAVTARGIAVTCAAPGRSVAFIGRRPSS
jgi:hypothetical protein